MWFHLRLLEECNLQCTSCYAKERDRTSKMSFQLVTDIVESILRLEQRSMRTQKFSVAYLSGGEPLLHPDILSIIEYCYMRFDRVSILTNGLLVPRYINHFPPFRDKLCVQVSLDGDEETNDRIRGHGVFKKVVEALDMLNLNNIPHWFSYTVSQLNRHCIDAVIDIAQRTNSLFNNVTPYVGDRELMLSYKDWKEFKYFYELKTRLAGLDYAHGPNCCGFKNQCGEFFSGITFNPDGRIAGCARLNNVMGDFTEMEKYIKDDPVSIHSTCMKPVWGDIPNFEFIHLLE